MKTLIQGVGDTITIAPTNGRALVNFTVPSNEVWTLEALNVGMWMPNPGDTRHFVFHLFVTDEHGTVGSPLWMYGTPQNDSQYHQPKNCSPHLRIAGPASGGFVVINITGNPQLLYWSALWTTT